MPLFSQLVVNAYDWTIDAQGTPLTLDAGGTRGTLFREDVVPVEQAVPPKLVISGENQAPVATLTASSADPAFPAVNLQNASVYRSWALGSVEAALDWDHGQPVELQLFALVGIEASPGASWQIQCGTAVGLADVWDSGALLIEQAPPSGLGISRLALHLAPTPVTARFTRIRVKDVAGSFRAAVAVLASVVTFRYDFEPNYRVGVELVGSRGFEREARKLSLSLDWVSEGERDELLRLYRLDRRHIVLPRPRDLTSWPSEGIFASVVRAPQVHHNNIFQNGGPLYQTAELSFVEAHT